jgi:hypothetical protein
MPRIPIAREYNLQPALMVLTAAHGIGEWRSN